MLCRLRLVLRYGSSATAPLSCADSCSSAHTWCKLEVSGWRVGLEPRCFSDSTFSTHYLIVAADDRYHTFGMLVVRDSTIPPSFTSRPEPHPPALTTSEPSVAGMIVPESWFVKRRSACSHQRSTMWSPANVKVCCITGSWILAQNTSILGLRTMNPCGRMYILDTIISIKVLLVSITGVWWPWDCRDPVSVDMSVQGSGETQSIPETR